MPIVRMKHFLKFLAYLPVILMAVAAILIVVHMVNVTEFGRHRVSIVKNRKEVIDHPGTPSPSLSEASNR
jgi:hypothetical protein